MQRRWDWRNGSQEDEKSPGTRNPRPTSPHIGRDQARTNIPRLFASAELDSDREGLVDAAVNDGAWQRTRLSLMGFSIYSIDAM